MRMTLKLITTNTSGWIPILGGLFALTFVSSVFKKKKLIFNRDIS